MSKKGNQWRENKKTQKKKKKNNDKKKDVINSREEEEEIVGEKYISKNNVMVYGVKNKSDNYIMEILGSQQKVANINRTNDGNACVTFWSSEFANEIFNIPNITKFVFLKKYESPSSYWAEKIYKQDRLLSKLKPDNLKQKIRIMQNKKNNQIFNVNDRNSWKIIIKNESNEEIELLKVFSFHNPKYYLFIEDNIIKSNDSKTIKPNGEYEVKINFETKVLGGYRIVFVILFDNNEYFKWIEYIQVGDPSISKDGEYEEVQPDTYVREIIPAFPPTRRSQVHKHITYETNYEKTLEVYPVPENVQNDIDKQSYFMDLKPWCTKDNYVNLIEYLLWIEEAETKKQLRRYDLIDSTFEYLDLGKYYDGRGEYYPEPITRIIVKGLSERRPSVLKGDRVFAWVSGTFDLEYEGWVHDVEEESLVVMFCSDFQSKFPQDTKFNVRFTKPNIQERMMHRAVRNLDLSIVFPNIPENVDDIYKKDLKIKYIDGAIEENYEQKLAVESVLKKDINVELRKFPFLLFGPFGTGKSRTLIEIIKQIYTREKNARILICAPTNNAVNKIVSSLIDFGISNKEMFRLFSAFANFFGLKFEFPHILDYTIRKDNLFFIPDKQDLLKYKIIATTCMNAGQLVGIGFPNQYFTHILIDEAAQLMEAEINIPLSLASVPTNKHKGTVVVLAGDPKQLGPHLHSKSAINHKLDHSLMERLYIKYGQYRQSGICGVHLTNNYRSHHSICKLSSDLFYDGKIKPQANFDDEDIPAFDFSYDVTPSFPIYFFAVEGVDEREKGSPSFFNIEEIKSVYIQIDYLVENQGVDPKDIGVITPFFKQTKKIRDYLRLQREKGFGDVKVGSVEEFQGHEKKILIISTVRSSKRHLNNDQHFGLGFLRNIKRINTSITRACMMLVFVGDPYILCEDENWKKIIDECKKNGNYNGKELNEEYFKKRETKDVPLSEPLPEIKAPNLGKTPPPQEKEKVIEQSTNDTNNNTNNSKNNNNNNNNNNSSTPTTTPKPKGSSLKVSLNIVPKLVVEQLHSQPPPQQQQTNNTTAPSRSSKKFSGEVLPNNINNSNIHSNKTSLENIHSNKTSKESISSYGSLNGLSIGLNVDSQPSSKKTSGSNLSALIDNSTPILGSFLSPKMLNNSVNNNEMNNFNFVSGFNKSSSSVNPHQHNPLYLPNNKPNEEDPNNNKVSFKPHSSPYFPTECIYSLHLGNNSHHPLIIGQKNSLPSISVILAPNLEFIQIKISVEVFDHFVRFDELSYSYEILFEKKRDSDRFIYLSSPYQSNFRLSIKLLRGLLDHRTTEILKCDSSILFIIYPTQN